MSVDYKTTFKKQEGDKEVSFSVFLPREFGKILGNGYPKSSYEKSAKPGEDDPFFKILIEIYDFSIIDDFIEETRKRRDEYAREEKEMAENSYKASCIEVYESMCESRASLHDIVKESDEEIAFAEFIKHGVEFHFMYTADMMDVDNIVMEVEQC